MGCAGGLGFPACPSKWADGIFKYMPLSQKNVDELKAIYKETVGEELSDKEAWDMAIRLLNLFKVLQNYQNYTPARK